MTKATSCARKLCGKAFTAKQSGQKYCSRYCKDHNRQVISPNRVCIREGCGKEFRAHPINKRYCSPACFTAVHNRKLYGTESLYPDLSTATIGAIGELRVCSDLLARGYEVFRALSPSCSCDLAVLRGDELARVEVRTGYRNKLNGKIWGHPPKNSKADIFAVVYRDGIQYRPLKEWIKCQNNWVALWGKDLMHSTSTSR